MANLTTDKTLVGLTTGSSAENVEVWGTKVNRVEISDIRDLAKKKMALFIAKRRTVEVMNI